MMSHADLPISFWGYALETAAFTLNRVPSKAVDKTPYQIWFGKTPSLSFLKIWGCEVFVRRQISEKLAAKSDKCVFVGYPKETRGYYFYNPTENKVFVARNGVFMEKEFLSKDTNGNKVSLEEVQEPQTNTEPPVGDQLSFELVESPQVTQGPRRSGRMRHEPERYGFLVTDSCDVLLMDQDEPTTYQEAVSGLDSDKWLSAMNSEMQSMYDNQV